MKKKIWVLFSVVMMLIITQTFIFAQSATLCGPNEGIDVLNGEYRINNNIWGSGAGQQCINVNDDNFIVASSTHNSTGVMAYPFIYKGYHHWDSTTTNSGLPARISDVSSAPISWTIGGTDAGGSWNAAFESWYSINGFSDPANGGELMIWINYNGPNAIPGGTQVDTTTIEGHTWNVYYADWNWNYIAYQAVDKMTSINFDLKAFQDDAVRRGYLDSNWFLDNLEAGFEIWVDGQGLESVSFSGDVYQGTTTPSINIGDVNSDGTINIVDALLTSQYYVGLDPQGFNINAADANCDGTINIVDALLFSQYYVGLINHFC